MMREKCGPISGIRKELRIEESQRPEPVWRARVIWKNRARAAIGKSNQLGDAVRADIFTEISWRGKMALDGRGTLAIAALKTPAWTQRTGQNDLECFEVGDQ